MEDINLSKLELSNLEKLSTNSTNSEGIFYFYNTSNEKKLIKIIRDFYNRYTQIGLKNIKILKEYNGIISLEFPEFVLPEALVYIENQFRGYIMQYINGITLSDYLNNPNIPLEEKLHTLKEIGKLLDKLSNFKKIPYNIVLGDFHENNIIITDDYQIRIIDLNGMCLNPEDIPNCKYLNIAVDELRHKGPKYEVNILGEVTPNNDTDIFCYGMILMNFISQCEFAKLPYYEIKRYLNHLKLIGFSIEFIDCIEKLYSSNKNENPYPYIESISKEMLEKASIKSYRRTRFLK